MDNKQKAFAWASFLTLTLAAMPEVALATGQDDFAGVGARICDVVDAVTGNLGRAIATLAVVFLGIGAFFGKVTWGLAIAVALGIFAIFGSAAILEAFEGGRCQGTGT